MSTSSRTRPVAPALLLALSLAGLAACGQDSGDADDPAGSAPESPATAVDERAAHGDRVCPDELPRAEGQDDAALEGPARTAPELPATEEAWVCRFDPADEGGGDGGGGMVWERAGEALQVADGRLGELDQHLAALAPAPEDRACTADIGPRWMLVTVREGDLTGVVVDDFGCRDVRLTAEPFEVAPGADEPGQGGAPGTAGVVPGTLSAPAGLLAVLRSTRAGEGGDEGRSSEHWASVTARLSCPGPHSVFMHDMAEPAPGTTPQEAVESWRRPGATVEIVDLDRAEETAIATVVVDGRTETVLSLLRWDNGGWAVEGGAEC